MPEVYLEKKTLSILNFERLPEDLRKTIVDDLSYQIFEFNIKWYDRDTTNNMLTIRGTRKQLFKYLRNLATITDYIVRDI